VGPGPVRDKWGEWDIWYCHIAGDVVVRIRYRYLTFWKKSGRGGECEELGHRSA